MSARADATAPVPMTPHDVQVVIAGLGAVGTPLALGLRSLGVLDFILADPKVHKRENVLTQCDPEDVGRAKVKVAAEELRRRQARSVLSWQRPVQRVEPGWLGPGSVVVACGDRLTAVREAHELARALRVPFFRLNVEPACSLATLSAFDYRPEVVSCCALCGYRGKDFSAQENELSCSPTPERPTGSPRALSGFAANWGALMILRALTDADFPHWNTSLSFFAGGPQLQHSVQPEQPDCLGSHEQRGRIVRLADGPRVLSFARLCELAKASPQRAVLDGSGELARRARCDRCGSESAGCWWIQPARPAGRCRCGGASFAVPFAKLAAFERAHLAGAWTRPLSELGVPTRARISVRDGEAPTHFLIA